MSIILLHVTINHPVRKYGNKICEFWPGNNSGDITNPDWLAFMGVEEPAQAPNGITF